MGLIQRSVANALRVGTHIIDRLKQGKEPGE